MNEREKKRGRIDKKEDRKKINKYVSQNQRLSKDLSCVSGERGSAFAVSRVLRDRKA